MLVRNVIECNCSVCSVYLGERSSPDLCHIEFFDLEKRKILTQWRLKVFGKMCPSTLHVSHLYSPKTELRTCFTSELESDPAVISLSLWYRHTFPIYHLINQRTECSNYMSCNCCCLSVYLVVKENRLKVVMTVI